MQELIIFAVGLIAGFLGATVGGGGMVAIPALMLLGFSPQSTVAINKVGDVGAFISAIGKYWKSKKIDWKMAIPLAVIALIASIIGTQVMVMMNTDFLQLFIGLTILFFLPFFLFGKSIGIKHTKPSRLRKISGLVIYLLLAVQGAIVLEPEARPSSCS